MPPSDLLPPDTTAALSPDGLVGRHVVTVEWGDCDPAGIIYYPTYFKWWDQSTWRLFWAVGIDRATMRDAMGGVEMPILNAAGTFESTVTPGDRLTVESRVERWGGSSFTVAHRAVRADGSVVAHGKETRCWTVGSLREPGKLKAQRVPDEIVSKMGGRRS